MIYPRKSFNILAIRLNANTAFDWLSSSQENLDLGRFSGETREYFFKQKLSSVQVSHVNHSNDGVFLIFIFYFVRKNKYRGMFTCWTGHS